MAKKLVAFGGPNAGVWEGPDIQMFQTPIRPIVGGPKILGKIELPVIGGYECPHCKKEYQSAYKAHTCTCIQDLYADEFELM